MIIPCPLPPIPDHDHDDEYYTETEVDNLLAGKADDPHDHDDRYYTETEVDDLLSSLGGAPVIFVARVTSNIMDVTGDGTSYAFICDDVQRNEGGCYSDVTGRFTAPSDGTLHASIGIWCGGIGAGHLWFMLWLIKNSWDVAVTLARDDAQKLVVDAAIVRNFSTYLPMSEGDYVYPLVMVSGSPKSVDIIGDPGGAGFNTWFSGQFIPSP